ncbi:MAG: hypothetical protein ABW195_12005 [Ilumatobacteraceae bacterium]
MAAAAAIVGCGGDDDAATTDATVELSVAVESTDAAVESTDAVGTTEAVEATDVMTTDVMTTDAVEETTADVDTTMAAEGFPFTSPEGDFTVVFPGEPTEQTTTQSLPDGTPVEIVITGYQEGDSFVATARTEYPAGSVLDPATALQGAQDQALANVGGTLIDSADITLQGRPGREFSAAVTSGGQSGTVLQRVYLDGLVSYQQIYTGKGDAAFTDPELAPFFESFAFTTG